MSDPQPRPRSDPRPQPQTNARSSCKRIRRCLAIAALYRLGMACLPDVSGPTAARDWRVLSKAAPVSAFPRNLWNLPWRLFAPNDVSDGAPSDGGDVSTTEVSEGPGPRPEGRVPKDAKEVPPYAPTGEEIPHTDGGPEGLLSGVVGRDEKGAANGRGTPSKEGATSSPASPMPLVASGAAAASKARPSLNVFYGSPKRALSALEGSISSDGTNPLVGQPTSLGPLGWSEEEEDDSARESPGSTFEHAARGGKVIYMAQHQYLSRDLSLNDQDAAAQDVVFTGLTSNGEIANSVKEVLKELLMKLYDAATFDELIEPLGLFEDDHCDWHFVDCTDDHMVSGLSLCCVGQRLPGTIPPVLGRLKHLKDLNLYDIGLKGSIPTEIGSLTELQTLDLSKNELTGSVPTEIGNLIKLKTLHLHENELTGPLPREIGNLIHVQDLSLYSNELTGSLPRELGHLVELKHLRLYSNGLTGSLPTEIGNLIQLQTLYLSHNKLTGSTPTEIGRLIELQVLNIYLTELTGSIPKEIGNLIELKELHFFSNKLTGSIPSEIGSMTALETLLLIDNELTGSIPSEIGNMTNLQYVSISENKISGHIPREIGNLIELYGLHLNGNNLTGSLPREIGKMANLGDLDISHNKISGHIPVELGKMIQLYRLYLIDNELTGPVPKELGGLTQLQKLNLGINQLSGSIPTELADLTNIWYLDLHSNHLVESIPSQLGVLNKLKSLILSSNKLSGPIATDLGGLTKLQKLDLHSNRLYGTLPLILGYMTELRKVDLSNNGFNGPIPTQIGNLVNLRQLYLSTNELSDRVPTELGGLAHLQELDLSRNALRQNVPSELTNITSLTHLNLSHNNFKSFFFGDEWQVLESCDLSHNKIYGKLPSKWNGLPSLRKLLLSKNSFFGQIPKSLHTLTQLEKLHIDYNDLIGTIPDVLALMSLREMKLSHNRGEIMVFAESSCDMGTSEYSAGAQVCCDDGHTGTICSYDVRTGRVDKELFFLGTGLYGTIPAGFANDPYLEVLELAGNKLTGAIPPEIGEVFRLKRLDLANNMLHGLIPSELGALKSATVILAGNDKMRDSDENVTAPLSLCNDVPGFDLRNETAWCPPERNLLRDFFEEAKGQEWTNKTGWSDEYGDHCRWHGIECRNSVVTKLVLDNNGLSGRISSSITELESLEVIDLNNNDLKGNIPKEIGRLQHLSHVRFSYNELTGEVPLGLGNLSGLELFHLHSNHINGTLPNLKIQKTTAFVIIADCGSPSYLNAALECPDCTMCCNSLGECHYTEEAKDGLLEQAVVVISSGLAFFVIVAIISVVPNKLQKVQSIIFRITHYTLFSGLHVQRDAEFEAIGEDSVYHFFLSDNLVAWFVAFGTMVAQAISFGIFVNAASLDFSDDGKDWVYSYICPRNSLECRETSAVKWYGWVYFGLLMTIYLVPDMFNALKLLWIFAIRHDFSPKYLRVLFGGFCLFAITVLAVYASMVYNIAIARSNTELIVNTVVILFITDLDEQTYKMLYALFPKWSQATKEKLCNDFRGKIRWRESVYDISQNATNKARDVKISILQTELDGLKLRESMYGISQSEIDKARDEKISRLQSKLNVLHQNTTIEMRIIKEEKEKVVELMKDLKREHQIEINCLKDKLANNHFEMEKKLQEGTDELRKMVLAMKRLLETKDDKIQENRCEES